MIRVQETWFMFSSTILIYGGIFADVYKWEVVIRIEPDWTRFNKIVPLTSTEQQIIDNLQYE